MRWFFLLFAVVGLKTLFCKGLSLAIFLLLFWMKGQKIGFHHDKWDDFFLQMSPQAVQRSAISIYFTAAVLSSAISYLILKGFSYPYSLAIASFLFVGGVAITAYRWHRNGKAYLLKRYQEIPQTILSRRNGEETKSEQVTLRGFQTSDRPALETIVRETWEYDRFCSPKTAAKIAKVYLNSCLTNQTFIRVAAVEGVPVGIIMGKDLLHHKCPLSLRLAWLRSVIGLLITKEGREIAKLFDCIQGIDDELISHCKKTYQGELTFFAIRENYRGRGLGRQLFQTVVEDMHTHNIAEFFLFTDTSCNYPFYEHLGMRRCGEKKQVIHTHGGDGNMTFFMYEYQIKKGEPSA